MSTGKPEHVPRRASARLVVRVPGSRPQIHTLVASAVTVGQAGGNSIQIGHPSVSGRHARLENQGGEFRLIDVGSTNGTKVNGVPVGDVLLRDGDKVEFGSVEAVFRNSDSTPVGRICAMLLEWKKGLPTRRPLAVSIAIHVTLVLLLGRAILFHQDTPPSDFSTEEGGFLVQDKPDKPGKAGEESALASGVPQFNPQAQPVPSAMGISSVIQTISTTSAPLSFQVGAVTPSAASSVSSMQSAIRGAGGPGSGLGKGFGKGSGLGKGLGDWIGSGGIGISGRGKTLKTVNEFFCYFVIHSGDWYAALDWRGAPQARQTELSPAGLPDAANISWYQTTPMPGIGPFITYRECYGFLPRPNRPGEVDDCRGGCVEFTPGAMSNLLRFIRAASNNNIKGGAKPKAVVLDRKLVPYTYEKITNQMTWNPASRENLRETLRKALPPGGRFGDTHGYLWNPDPANKQQDDFLIEFLLDVKPMPPFVYFTGNDDFTLNDTEVETLNEYARRGGAIWGDCGFAGNRSKFDVAFRREMKRVIPDEDKPFRELPRNSTLFVRGDDAYFDLPELPTGMQYYQAPVQVIEITPGVISVVLTKNAYGNFLRFDMTMVNNQFQMGGELGRGRWVNKMWDYRDEFFRGMSDETVMNSYSLGSNILVYMLGRWPSVLNRLENR